MTATVSLAAADAQQARVRAIMAKTGCTFEKATDAYIEERRGLVVLHKPMITLDTTPT